MIGKVESESLPGGQKVIEEVSHQAPLLASVSAELGIELLLQHPFLMTSPISCIHKLKFLNISSYSIPALHSHKSMTRKSS